MPCIARLRSGNGNRRVPEALKEMVSRCWDADYDKRPEMTEVIAILQKVRAMHAMTPVVARMHVQQHAV